MTVSTTATKITAEGNGATTAWPFPFALRDDDEVVVTLTESDGTVTTLSSSAYSVVVNSASGTNPTPVGGTVTYPLSGTPVPLGDFITVQRIAPYLQPTSLANQGISWQSTIEAALDNVVFQTQQLNFQIGQQFSVPVSDDPPAELPIASERANLWAYFDSDGNMTAAAAPSGGVAVSAAMVPVVGAASLALARTAFGLGDVATKNVSTGLIVGGATLRAAYTPVADAGNKAVITSFHFTDRHATGALTYTCPAISTLFVGFGFFVSALTAACTFAIDAGDAFSGAVAGASLTIPPGTQVFISTDGTNTWFVRELQAMGMHSPLNLQLNATVATNALTISVKDRNGNDPSTASPVIVPYRDPTIANGNPVIRALTSALSIVVPDTALLGTANAIPFRVWIGIFDNAGTQVLGVFVSVVGGATPTSIVAIDESAAISGIAVSVGSDLGGTWYTASTITSKAFRILGYLDFSAGQAAAGTWATAPDKVQLFGPGIKLPGDPIKSVITRFTTAADIITTFPSDNTIPEITEGTEITTRTFTAISKCNLCRISTNVYGTKNAAGSFYVGIFQNGVTPAHTFGWSDLRAASVPGYVHAESLIVISTASEITFSIRGGVDANTLTINGAAGARLYGGSLITSLEATEIMT